MAALLRHIEGRVASIEQRKDELVDEIQLAVDMVCKVKDVISGSDETHTLPRGPFISRGFESSISIWSSFSILEVP